MQGKILLPHTNFTAKNATQIRGNALASGAPPQTISFAPVTSLTTFLMLPTGLTFFQLLADISAYVAEAL